MANGVEHEMLIGLRTHYVSLNKAVTIEAFGEPRTPEQELALRQLDQNRVRDLVIRCQDEAKGKPEFLGFQRPLPYLPRAALKHRLDELRRQWPPSASKLYALVERLEVKWQRYDEQYAAALDRIFDSLRQDRNQLVGRTGAHRAAPVRVIKPIYFFGTVTIGHDMSSVGPPVAIQELLRPGAILHTRPGLIPIYYGVRISTKTPRHSLGLRARVTRPEVRAKHEKQLVKWYRDRVKKWPATERQPSQDCDEKEAQQLFPHVPKLRPLIRELRRKYLKPIKGRPKLATK